VAGSGVTLDAGQPRRLWLPAAPVLSALQRGGPILRTLFRADQAPGADRPVIADRSPARSLSARLASATAACTFAAAIVGSQVSWTWRDFNLPFRGYIGETAYAIVRSPFATGSARLGFAESGRIGFLYPDRVVNLDGKMQVDALDALRNGGFARFVQSAGLDFIVLHGFDIEFFDKVAPGWRDGYERREDLASFIVFDRKR
jgi:hypothetical protein